MNLNPFGLFITGTDTGVGKTRIGVSLVRLLKRCGLKVLVRKPAETGCVQTEDGLLPTDAESLSRAAGEPDSLEIVCPYRFKAAVSPERAAFLEGRSLTLDQLIEACRPREDGMMVVEGAGGFYSPIANAALNADLAQALGFPVLLVAADRLGVIHQVLVTLEAIIHRGLVPAGVVLNQNQQAKPMDNLADLRRWCRVPVYPIPLLQPGEEAALENSLLPLIEDLQRLGLALPKQ